MQTRNGRQQLRVERADIVVTTTSPPALDGPPPVAPRRPLALALVGGLVLALVATLALIWVTGGDGEVVATPPAQSPAQGPVVPAPLTVAAEGPETVVAGQPARFVVTWADGSGEFVGSTEDWGDIGVSSVREGRCDPSAPAEPAASGEYAVSHTWSEPGTYSVVLGVTTTTCTAGASVREESTASMKVTVQPAP